MSSSDFSEDKNGPKIYTVGALTSEIRDLLEEHFEFVWVEGEISNFRRPSSGHFYMVLKDAVAQIRAVMFRPQARFLKFLPEDGMKVIAQGRISLYQPRGEYQIILDYLEPLGVGALAAAFEQLKKKLATAGVFDEDKKRPLPDLPQKVAVITSPTGAAIQDFLKVIHRRFSNIEVTVVPVKVQGEGASEEIIEALKTVNRVSNADVLVLTRGGGSMEDLWAFNDEGLALEIRESKIPVVSAVGHEIDFTIADLAADFRAPTPSAAAEMLVSEKEALIEGLENKKSRLITGFKSSLAYRKQRLQYLSKQVRDPRKRMADFWMRLEDWSSRMIREMEFIISENKNRLRMEARTLRNRSPFKVLPRLRENLENKRHLMELSLVRAIKDERSKLSQFEKRINDLSPLNVLERGYSITRMLPQKEILRDAGNAAVKDRVQVLLANGELECRVEKIYKGKQ